MPTYVIGSDVSSRRIARRSDNVAHLVVRRRRALTEIYVRARKVVRMRGALQLRAPGSGRDGEVVAHAVGKVCRASTDQRGIHLLDDGLSQHRLGAIDLVAVVGGDGDGDDG